MSSTIQKSLFVIAFLLGCIVMGLFSRSAMSQSPSSASGIGRYQLMPVGEGLKPYVFIIDTTTGRSWMQDEPGDPWKEVTPDPLRPPGLPAQPPVK